MLKIPFIVPADFSFRVGFVRRKWLSTASAALFIFGIVESGHTQNYPQFIANELLVGFRSGVSRKNAENIHRTFGAELIEELC
jgi:hypothetical protein